MLHNLGGIPILSEYAIVFWERQVGQFESRRNPPAEVTEYIFHKNEAAEIVPAGAIKVDDDGTVVEVVEAILPGGEQALWALMSAAGWNVPAARRGQSP